MPPFLPCRSVSLLSALFTGVLLFSVACESGSDADSAMQGTPSSSRDAMEERDELRMAMATKEAGDIEPEASATPGPDLLPDLATTMPDDMYIDYDWEGRKLLRFSTTVENRGEGPMKFVGLDEDEQGRVRAKQILEQRDGSEREAWVTDFVMSDEHAHWHLDNFALFELWRFDGGVTLTAPEATQNKITFCLIDEVPIEPPPPHVADEPEFLACEWDLQGISAGWSETYVAALPEQWVDVTGLPDGQYVLRMTLDPDGMLIEAKKGNNAVLVFLEMTGDEVTWDQR